MTKKVTEEIDTMVWDFSQVMKPSKSEIRRRLLALIESSQRFTLKEVEEKIDACREISADGMWWINRNDIFTSLTNNKV